MNNGPQHIPVLQTTALQILAPTAGESVLDVTLGLGGHASSFLEKTSPDGMLTALDADMQNLMIAKNNLASYGDRVHFIHANFSQLAGLGLPPFDIVFADLGLSSPHVDDPERGFSFRFDGPLDLRYDRTSGKTAHQMIQSADEDELIEIFRHYGELFREAKKLAMNMAGKDIATTTDLKKIVEDAFGFRAKRILPQVFQALRIAVNDELHALRELLNAGIYLLKPGGRMGVISYHSLEDRMVKHHFRDLCTPEKDLLTGKISREAPFTLITPKAVVPSDSEIASNPRARSAKFRVIHKRLPT